MFFSFSHLLLDVFVFYFLLIFGVLVEVIMYFNVIFLQSDSKETSKFYFVIMTIGSQEILRQLYFVLLFIFPALMMGSTK